MAVPHGTTSLNAIAASMNASMGMEKSHPGGNVVDVSVGEPRIYCRAHVFLDNLEDIESHRRAAPIQCGNPENVTFPV